MKRKDFIQIIKLRSVWKIDKRRGNYTLPSGNKLSDYVEELVESQMKIDNLGIRANGDLCFCEGGDLNLEGYNFEDYLLKPGFEENEICAYDKMQKRIKHLVFEIVE